MMGSLTVAWWVIAGVVLTTLAYLGYKYVAKGKKKLPVNQERIDKKQAEVREDEKKELADIEKRKQDLEDASNEPDKRKKLKDLADLVNKDGGK